MSETLKTAQEQRIESRHYVKESQHYKSIMPMTYEMALDLLDDADTAARLQEALESIMEIMDADNPESYRSDDREGAMDTAYSVAKRALEGKEAIK